MTSDGAMAEGRRADAERRRQRVLKVIDSAAKGGEEITVSSIARAAGVDRSFLYRHRDLLTHLHSVASTPATSADRAERVSRASLQADLAHALAQNRRLATRVQQLEKRLSQLLGEQAWRDSGLGAAADLDQLQRHVTTLEQRMVDLQSQLEERTEELQAARAANRELTRSLNHSHR
ncbi:DUF6262 family protein [Streptomyces diastatochromogenes]|uniref:Uncharacterized protein n=1 Tax=Streptomyces diastatochromogenes TaxID=42236 RepID=A0A233SNM9_STRDA|nr:DUF6262 family protein [Streptomyces diastatochromogenes]MCZ0986943.1 DUF6262 family protein [Streptomyces diastatochromogenes]OXY97256.1 hypothetical protein BEK98_10045 [Streptomyces diastatochromogenes]